MQLSLQARKAVAAGLAASTLLWSAAGALPKIASAAVHSEGCLVLSGGIVWLITGGTRRGFTSAEVFQSHGRNFSQVVTASAEDVALPVGPIMTYDDGTLVKGPNDPLVYLVANGQKRPFVSGSVFLGLGYSFANIQQAPVNTFSDLPTGSNLDSTTIAHPAGTLVIYNGAVWEMSANGRMGFSSAAAFNSYGKGFNMVVQANSYDLALSDQGIVPSFPACTGGGTTTPPPVSGNVNVSLASSASTTLIADSESDAPNYSQAIAPLASFVFSGSATVTSVTLQRTGVSVDSMLSSVYLFDGTTRVTDAGSFSSNALTFTNSAGLFTVSGSKTITVRADLDDGTTDNQYSGQTVGVNLTAVGLAGGSVGGLPVMGPVHTVTSASLATVTIGAVTDAGASDPGSDIKVWEASFTVGVRDVTFSRFALRQIGNIVNSDIRNFRLLVDGVQVAQTQNIDANGYVTFSGFSKVLQTNPTVRVIADVIGGSSRTLEMSLRNKADVELVDSQYNVNISADDSYPADSDGVAINQGNLTVEKATDSPSGNVTNNASFQKLGKWTLTAFGEPIKVENLYTALDWSGTDANLTLRNGKLFVNGSQVGSTTGIVAAGPGDNDGAVDTDLAATFTTNFIVTPGTPTVVELYADIYDEETAGDELAAGDTLRVYLLDSDANNAVRQVSLSSFDAPDTADVAANVLTVATGSMSLAKDNAYGNQNVVVPASNFKIGDFSLSGSSTEAINLNTITVDITVANEFDAADLTNVYVKYGSKTTSILSTVSAVANANTWSISEVLPINGSMDFEVYGNIATGAVVSETDDDDTVISSMKVTGITANSGQTVNGNAAVLAGQTITAKISGSLTVSVDSGTPVASQQVAGTMQADGSLKVKLTGTNEDIYVRDVTVRVDANADDVVLASMALFSSTSSSTGFVQKGTTQAWNNDGTNPGYATFTLTGGDRVLVPKNGSAYLLFKPTYVSSDQGSVSGLTPQLILTDLDADGSTALSASGTGANLVNASGIILSVNSSSSFVDSTEDRLDAAITAVATTVTTANGIAFAVGDIIFIDVEDDGTWDPATEELMVVLADGGANLTVARGAFGTTPVAYAAALTDNIYRLSGTVATFANASLIGNASTILKTKLSLAAASDSPSGATTGGTQKVIAKFVATAASNSADPGENKARIDWIDITATESAADVYNLSLYPSEFDLNSTYAAACGGISGTVWRCTLDTDAGSNEVVEGTSRTYIVRADVGYGAAGSIDVSIATLGTADTTATGLPSVTNDVNWNDGTTDITWVNQAITSLNLNASAQSTSAASGTEDTTDPAMTTLVAANVLTANSIAAGDTFTITFNEEINPASIHASLFPGGPTVTGIAGASTGGVITAIPGGAGGGDDTITITNIAVITITSMAAATTFADGTLALDTTGTILTVTVGTGTARVVDLTAYATAGVTTTVTDVSGETLAATAPTSSGSL